MKTIKVTDSFNQSLTLNDILVIEDDLTLLDFRCPETGVLLWPLIRTILVRMIMADLIYTSGEIYHSRQRLVTYQGIVTLSKSFLHNAWFTATKRSRADICIMTTGVSNQLVNGKLFNRLSDHFVEACPSRTLVIEDHFEWKWPFPRYNNNIMFHAPIQAKSNIVGRLNTRNDVERYAGKLVTLATQRAKKYLNWEIGEKRESLLTIKLQEKLAGLPYTYRLYQNMLSRIAPKLLMVEGACYGALSVIIAAAKAMEITVAEHQHGAVLLGHDGYNYAPSLQQSVEYKQILPEYFLSYGDWWNLQINAPIKKVSIGNPHRDATVSDLVKTKCEKRNVLILGDGLDDAIYIDLANQLAARLATFDLRVVYRPHPSKRDSIKLTGDFSTGVELDTNADIYQSLNSAVCVISELSTGLFEAIGIVDKIFVWNTTKAQFANLNHPFLVFNNVNELENLVVSPQVGQVPSHDFWKDNWKRNYEEFLSGVIGC